MNTFRPYPKSLMDLAAYLNATAHTRQPNTQGYAAYGYEEPLIVATPATAHLIAPDGTRLGEAEAFWLDRA